MIKKTASDEFVFIRDRLHSIARLLVRGQPSDIVESAFMIGCLHTVCCEDAVLFKEEEKETKVR